MTRLQDMLRRAMRSFGRDYHNLPEDGKLAVRSVYDSIAGYLEPRTTDARIRHVFRTIDSVAHNLYGSARTCAEQLVGTYAAYVRHTSYYRRHPERCNALVKLSHSLDSKCVRALKRIIAEQEGEISQLNSEKARILESAKRSARLCNRAFACFDTNPEKALQFYQKALEIEPVEDRKKVIHANIGGLYFNEGKYDLALAEFRLAARDEEIRRFMRLCRDHVRERHESEPAGEQRAPARQRHRNRPAQPAAREETAREQPVVHPLRAQQDV